DPLSGLVTLDDLGGAHELKLHRPHLGRHAPLVGVAVDVGELGAWQAWRDPRDVLHVLPHLLKRGGNMELVFDQHRLLTLLIYAGIQRCRAGRVARCGTAVGGSTSTLRQPITWSIRRGFQPSMIVKP